MVKPIAIASRAESDAMHLTPREIDKLMLHQAGFLAQKRLARGLRLNYPEAVRSSPRSSSSSSATAARSPS